MVAKGSFGGAVHTSTEALDRDRLTELVCVSDPGRDGAERPEMAPARLSSAHRLPSAGRKRAPTLDT